VGAIYYGIFASDQFVTEIQFGVRSADAQRNDATSIFQGMAAASQIGLQSNILVQYIKSREMVDAVDSKLDLRRIFGKPSADILARLDSSAPVEGLVDYWRGKVEPYFDLTTGIVSVKVRAFTAEESKAIASEILTLSENLAEELTKRSRADYVKYAQEQVDEAAARLAKARQALLEFRDQEKLLDPYKEADAARLGIGKIREELAKTRAEYLASRSKLDERSPVIVSLKDKIAALETVLRDAQSKLAGEPQSRDTVPLSRNMRGYEALETERQLAEKFYDGALQALQRAQFEASRRAMYLEVFVHPALAEKALYPRRLISAVIVALTAFGVWIFLMMTYYSIREHV
jgi:capsular polysaccharide transport system permease protein